MYSNNIVNFQECMTILNAHTKKVWKLIVCTSYIYIYIYIYIYCHPLTDCFVISQLFSVARHVGRLKLGSKPPQLYVRLSIILLSQQANHISSGITRHYVIAFVCLHFCLIGYQTAQLIRRTLYYASGSRKFLRQTAQRIHSPPQTDFFFISQFFSVARQVGRIKLGSKPTQLYIRLRIILCSPKIDIISLANNFDNSTWNNIKFSRNVLKQIKILYLMLGDSTCLSQWESARESLWAWWIWRLVSDEMFAAVTRSVPSEFFFRDMWRDWSMF